MSKSASADEIRSAYRKLAKSLHPDARPGDKAAEERFKQVGQAFKLLSDPQSKARFDRGEIDSDGNERAAYHFRSRPGGPAGERGPSGRFEDISDIFSDLFSDGMGPQGRRGRAQAQSAPRPKKGADVSAVVRVSFQDAVRGAKKRVELQGGRAVEVAIPAGVEDRQVLRLRGQGAPGAYGGKPGDALVDIRVETHPHLRRDGSDIHLDLPISLKEALFGAVVRAPTADGMVEVRVPAGATSGALLRLRAKGVGKPEGNRGDQIIKLVVDVPTNDPELESFVEAWTPPKDYDPRRRFKS